ncbi:MCE family protein [Nocardioides cavernaquae]|uniref:MCE family protein n=1 Tax=Nocardioides cavernaquae TaxID=2321396 RepID=A0A3A5HG30_9ACTN|nr:MlaD family protein [Nocardioides cavernaquae]RJS46697.1 MCE family protein [Nocardioides cavernaquae]
MMLTPLIRRQLRVFVLLTVVCVGLTTVVYARVPQQMGIGVYDVSADFTDASGLYPRAMVTFRGVKVGTVSALELDGEGARATLQLDSDAEVPSDAVAELHSTSAIGEQYIDLVPGKSTSYLEHGAVIPPARTREMPQISPVLDKLNGLLKSVPTDKTRRVLEQLDEGLGGSGDDLGGVIDSTSEIIAAASAELDSTTSLIATLQPVLATQQAQMGHTQAYADALASFTTELAAHDAEFRDLLASSPQDLRTLRGVVGDIRPTLPKLLKNTTTDARVLNTYLANLEQILVVYPATAARLQSTVNPRAAQGDVQLDLRGNLDAPRHCTEGYLGTGQRRSPADGSVRAVDGTAHCKLAKSAPSSVRGARNLPCPNSSARAALPAGCGLTFGSSARGSSGRPVMADLAALMLGAEGLDGAHGTPLTGTAMTEGDSAWQSLVLGPLGLA